MRNVSDNFKSQNYQIQTKKLTFEAITADFDVFRLVYMSTVKMLLNLWFCVEYLEAEIKSKNRDKSFLLKKHIWMQVG